MSDAPLTRYRITVAYHGGAFVGWQVQPNGPSVQAALEDALERFLGHRPRVEGSGRTDAGVHAYGQVAAFSSPVVRPVDRIRDGLNAHLPPTIACVDAAIVESAFDPRRHAKRKRYRYTWLERRARCPLRDDRVWHIRRPLDVAAMHEAAQHIVGTHPLDSFRAAGCAAATTVRTIPAAQVARNGDLVTLDIEGHGFLRHTVRILAGTLTDVGLGKSAPADVARIRDARDRDSAGRTAPAKGLALMWVRYDGPGPTEAPVQ